MPFRAIGAWIASSCRLVARKPHYWVPLILVLFVAAIACNFVPLAGNWLRAFVGGLFGAVVFALAWTQAAESRISLSRALSLVARVLPTLLAVFLIQIALEQAVELPVVRAIATDEEFATYALSITPAHQARPVVDLVHTVIGIVVSAIFAFAAPLAILHRMRALDALRSSVKAFALAPVTYVGFLAITVLVPHSLSYLGLWGGLAFIAIEILLVPVGYFVFRSAFGGEESGVSHAHDATLAPAVTQGRGSEP